MPVCTIASAAGVDGSVVAEKLQEQDNPDVGYDPATGLFLKLKSRKANFWFLLLWIELTILSSLFAPGEYVDVIKLGIIDPCKLIIKEIDDAIR